MMLLKGACFAKVVRPSLWPETCVLENYGIMHLTVNYRREIIQRGDVIQSHARLVALARRDKGEIESPDSLLRAR